jgi:predicted TIM-barrel fold metal-dependent hydrolase
MNKLSLLITLFSAMLLTNCANPTAGKEESEYYTDADYYTTKKADTHVHINTAQTYFITFSAKENFRLVDLNVDAPGYPAIEQQRAFLIKHIREFPDELSFCTTFRTDNGFEDSDWQNKTIAYLKSSFDSGAIGVKVWKNIGMTLRNKKGQFVMIDDPRFDPIFDFIEKSDKTLVGHLGEPKNCWLPLDSMTVNNDRSYFKEHPEYHMYLHPEYPSYQAQIDARDHMLVKHPHIRFDGAHLGSLEWSVDELAKRLDSFPNMAVDLAERLCHLEYQCLKNYQKVRDFVIKYQDRILYATDMEVNDQTDSVQEKKLMHDTRFRHWQFLTSDSVLTTPEVNGSFRGLHLPKTVVDKIYLKNAEKWFPAFKKD